MTLSFLLRLKRSPWAALACIAAMLLPLVACTIRKPIAAHSTNSNLAAEIANNRMLLLNIVRAMKYEPKYFTAVTMSRGQASASMTPSLAIPFGVGWLRDINPAAGLSVTATGGLSNVDVVVLDSHEFVRGLMQPVSTRTLAYFWRQGWDPEILFQLFFREIVSEPDANRGMTKKFESHAKDGFTDFQEFNGAIRNYLDKGLTACQVEKQVGPDFDMDSNLDTWISAASKAHDAGLHLTSDPNNENIQLMKNEMEFEFFWGDPNDRWRICLPENAAIRDNFRVENQGLWIRRSTEGIIYFLGQIMRQLEDEREKMLKGGTRGEPQLRICRDGRESPIRLFTGRRLDRTSGGSYRIKESNLVSVNHEGETYIIPDSPDHLNDRSMQALSLITQLIGLRKHREDLPTTGVVTAIQ